MCKSFAPHSRQITMPAAQHLIIQFWATICKTVHLCYRTIVLSVCLPALSLTLVHCGQTVQWIKMKLGMEVGLGNGHIVLDGDPAPPPTKKRALRIILHPITLSYNTALAYCKTESFKLQQRDFQNKFFKQICHLENCLHDLLPPKRDPSLSLRLWHSTV